MVFMDFGEGEEWFDEIEKNDYSHTVSLKMLPPLLLFMKIGTKVDLNIQNSWSHLFNGFSLVFMILQFAILDCATLGNSIANALSIALCMPNHCKFTRDFDFKVVKSWKLINAIKTNVIIEFRMFKSSNIPTFTKIRKGTDLLSRLLYYEALEILKFNSLWIYGSYYRN